MEFIIVTGLSGAGKTKAMHALEDIGFYCVDNLPPQLIPTFYGLCQKTADGAMQRVAVVTDIRGGDMFSHLFDALETLTQGKKAYKILFLDSRDDVLISRFKESRRRHPLVQHSKSSIKNAIQQERQIISSVQGVSHFIIDTSFLSVAQLKERISDLFLANANLSLMVNCMSFGFKYGLPIEADLVFDVRCLPNPHYIEALKSSTGLSDCVRSYVLSSDKTKGFIKRAIALIDYSLPLYSNEGKSQLVVAFGCTGGKHRSVALAETTKDHLLCGNIRVCVYHRDIDKL